MADETRLDTRQPEPRPAAGTRVDAPRAPQTRIEDAQARPFQPLPALLAARFTMVERIGSGGEATVWRCRSTDGHDRAIKLFHHPPRYRIDFDAPEFQGCFGPESCVRVDERGSDMGIHFEIMEYCALGSLDGFLRKRYPSGAPHQQAVDMLRRLTTALHAIQRGSGTTLVHGDVNPRNILVRSDTPLQLVFADFGLLVDLAGRSKLTNTGQGTAAYSAPGAPQRWRAEDDWWSIGMVVYRILLGHGYFEDDEGRELADSTIDAEINTKDISLAAVDALPLRSSLRDRWKRLLSGLLTRDPLQRWGFDEVSAWLAGRAPAVHRPEPAASPQPAPETPRRAATPFALPGVGAFHDAESLGTAMSRHPEAASRALVGRGPAALLNWLTTNFGGTEPYSEMKTYGDGWGPEELAAYFTAKLVPDAALTYRGRAITTASELRGLAIELDAATVVHSLFDRQLLGSLTGRNRPNYTMIDADWRDIVAHAEELGRTHRVPLQGPQRTHIVRYALLLAAGDDDIENTYISGVRRRLTEPGLALAEETPWFAALRRAAPF